MPTRRKHPVQGGAPGREPSVTPGDRWNEVDALVAKGKWPTAHLLADAVRAGGVPERHRGLVAAWLEGWRPPTRRGRPPKPWHELVPGSTPDSPARFRGVLADWSTMLGLASRVNLLHARYRHAGRPNARELALAEAAAAYRLSLEAARLLLKRRLRELPAAWREAIPTMKAELARLRGADGGTEKRPE